MPPKLGTSSSWASGSSTHFPWSEEKFFAAQSGLPPKAQTNQCIIRISVKGQLPCLGWIYKKCIRVFSFCQKSCNLLWNAISVNSWLIFPASIIIIFQSRLNLLDHLHAILQIWPSSKAGGILKARNLVRKGKLYVRQCNGSIKVP